MRQVRQIFPGSRGGRSIVENGGSQTREGCFLNVCR